MADFWAHRAVVALSGLTTAPGVSFPVHRGGARGFWIVGLGAYLMASGSLNPMTVWALDPCRSDP